MIGEDNRMIKDKIKQTYMIYQKDNTYKHVVSVACMASELANQYDLNVEKCILASLLHDISVIKTPDDMYRIAVRRKLDIDLSEEKYHFLLHQRISKIIAQEKFKIVDQDILSAIECHTTLKKNASDYDKIVF